MQSGTRNRGFASMDREKQREIARKGGKAAHEKGTAHEFTADEARAAGRKGGERVSSDRAHMSRIGRLGGKSSAGRRATKSSPEEGGEESTPGTRSARTSDTSGEADQSGGSSSEGERSA
jgi:general stress protein YciG